MSCSNEIFTFEPKALVGDKVSVLNYRCKPALWMEGTVIGVNYRMSFKSSFSESYEVKVQNNGKTYRLTVKKEHIFKNC